MALWGWEWCNLEERFWCRRQALSTFGCQGGLERYVTAIQPFILSTIPPSRFLPPLKKKQVEKEKESLRFELNKEKQRIKEADSAITAQKSEIEKLNHIINEADQERARQRKEFDLVVNERDILGTQLIRRNDELALLYEKIKIQQVITYKILVVVW